MVEGTAHNLGIMIDSGISIDSTPEILRLRFVTVKRNSAYFVRPRVLRVPGSLLDASRNAIGKMSCGRQVTAASCGGPSLGIIKQYVEQQKTPPEGLYIPAMKDKAYGPTGKCRFAARVPKSRP